MNLKLRNENVEKTEINSDLKKRLRRHLVVSNMSNKNVRNYSTDSGRMRGEYPQVKNVRGRKASRCLSCEPCLRADFGMCLCSRCLDMTNFGGSGRMKKACHERISMNMEVAPGTKL